MNATEALLEFVVSMTDKGYRVESMTVSPPLTLAGKKLTSAYGVDLYGKELNAELHDLHLDDERPSLSV